jgi:hypothetical protein
MSEPVDHHPAPHEALETAVKGLQHLLAQSTSIGDAQALQQVEREIIAATDALASAILAVKLQTAVAAEGVSVQTRALLSQAPKKLKSQGQREVTVQGMRGPAFTLRTAYYSPKTKRSRKKK